MFLTTAQLSKTDLLHLCSFNQQLADEISAVNRSLRPHGEAVTAWASVLPDTMLCEKEVIPYPSN